MTRQRTYERTHPWITFEVDLTRISGKIWVMLGECQSKCEHLAGTPLQPATAQKLHSIYMAKGVRATTAIEGNTLSEKDVRDHLEGKLTLPPSQEYLKQEIENIVEACTEIAHKMCSPEREPSLRVEDIKQFNRLALKNLALKDGGKPGVISDFMVGVPGYRGAPREDCEFLLGKLCEWLNTEWPDMEGELKIGVCILKAIMGHLYLAWIHPFPDGNGRTARLIEFAILLANRVPAPAAHLLSNHYNTTRTEYYRQLDYASKSKGDVCQWILYAIQGLRDGLRNQIKFVREQQLEVVWRDYVHSLFHGKKSEANHRRRELALEMPAGKFTPLGELTNINPDIAREYAIKTEKTLIRDLNVLRRMNLVVRTKQGYKPNRRIILAFLPARRREIAPAATINQD